MEASPLSRTTVGFGWALALMSVFNAVLVIIKEKNPAVLTGLKKMAGHQWTGHVLIVLVLFFVLGWVFAKAGVGQQSANRVTKIVLAGTLAGAFLIVGFYLLAD
jgi:uncharacterized membrane protein